MGPVSSNQVPIRRNPPRPEMGQSGTALLGKDSVNPSALWLSHPSATTTGGLSHSRGAIRWTARTLWPAKRGWKAEVFLSSQRVYGPPTALASTAETVRARPPTLRKTRPCVFPRYRWEHGLNTNLEKIGSQFGSH